MWDIAKLLIGIFLIVAFLSLGNITQSKKVDNFMLFMIFATIGIGTFFSVLPNDDIDIRYLQASWYLYVTDIPLIYYFGKFLKHAHFKGTKAISIDKLIFLFVTLCYLSTLWSTNKSAAFWGATNIAKFAWIFYIFKNMIDLETQRIYILNGLVASVWFQGIVGIAQKLNGGTIGLSFLGEHESGLRTRILDGETSMGVAGTFAHSGNFAVFLVFALFMLLLNKNHIKHNRFLATITLILISLYLAGSRTVLAVAFLILIIYYLSEIRIKLTVKKFVILVTVPALVVLFIVINYDALIELFSGISFINQISNRLIQWQIGWNEIKQRILLGHGINNYTDWMSMKYPGLYSTSFYYQNMIHNTYLQIWFDVGIVGLVLFCDLFIFSFISYFKSKEHSNFQIASLFFLVFTLGYYWTGWGMLKEPNANLVWIAFGLVYNKSDFLFENKFINWKKGRT